MAVQGPNDYPTSPKDPMDPNDDSTPFIPDCSSYPDVGSCRDDDWYLDEGPASYGPDSCC